MSNEINFIEAEDDIFTPFKTYWDSVHPTIPIAWPNDSFDPSELAAGVEGWVRVFTTGFTDGGHEPFSGSVATNLPVDELYTGICPLLNVVGSSQVSFVRGVHTGNPPTTVSKSSVVPMPYLDHSVALADRNKSPLTASAVC